MRWSFIFDATIFCCERYFFLYFSSRVIFDLFFRVRRCSWKLRLFTSATWRKKKKKNLIHGYHGIDVLENVISILYTSRFYMSSSGDWREMAVTTCVSDTWSYERVGILVHQSLTLLTSRHYWSMAHQSANLWFVVVPFQNSVGINVGLNPSFASFAISLYSLQFSRLWTELIFVIAY